MIDDLVADTQPDPSSRPPQSGEHGPPHAPARIGAYRILETLGEGGMGVVYAARDERLERTVAVKTMSSMGTDDTARRRFWREARAAASVNHPHVCQIYEIGEDAGALFIAMERLEGESLADRLRRGPLRVGEAVPIGLEMLAALGALHARGIVHRDLKPTNVFLTPHGVKLLDFGLAQIEEPTRTLDLTQSGTVLGTPRYMAPEQAAGEPADARTDLFAAGAILFEMLAGRPAFTGATLADVLYATRHEQPPALTGSPAIAAIDRVIRHALAKRPADRPASADAMAEDLRAVAGIPGGDAAADVHTLRRLVVLPFRVLRPDPETDFLAFSLPDAIATSLSSIRSIVVRSSAAAARFAGDAPDLKTLAAEADVDAVVLGTVLRVGDQLRASAQLVEAPGGTLLTSQTVDSSMGDLFRLQDDIARRVVEALALPLAGSVASPAPDAPRDPRAYELFLRANEIARTYDGLGRARDLYQACVDRDPEFAPAWARLGRCHRVIGKFVEPDADSEARAEDAFRRALALNPRLSIAHKFYANLEADMGRARSALVRLIGEANRRGNDPELFAGLVHACRYGGLFEESIAAHGEARRLDPNVPTSLEQTILMTGNLDRLLAVEPPPLIEGVDDGIRVVGLGLGGRHDEARRALSAMKEARRLPSLTNWIGYLEAWLDRRPDEMMARMAGFGLLKIQDDPEAVFEEGWLLCDAGAHDAGLLYVQRAVAKGYSAADTLAHAPAFEPLRRHPAFAAIQREADAGRARARQAFEESGGGRLLGL